MRNLVAGGGQVISQESLVRSLRLSQKLVVKLAPTHLNLVDSRFLLLAEAWEIIFDFSTLCTSGGYSVIQRIKPIADPVSHVNTIDRWK